MTDPKHWQRLAALLLAVLLAAMTPVTVFAEAQPQPVVLTGEELAALTGEAGEPAEWPAEQADDADDAGETPVTDQTPGEIPDETSDEIPDQTSDEIPDETLAPPPLRTGTPTRSPRTMRSCRAIRRKCRTIRSRCLRRPPAAPAARRATRAASPGRWTKTAC